MAEEILIRSNEMSERSRAFAWLLSVLHTEFKAKVEELYQEYRYTDADKNLEFHRQAQAVEFKRKSIDFIMDFLVRSMPEAENRSHGIREYFNSHELEFRKEFDDAFNRIVVPVRARKNPIRTLVGSVICAVPCIFFGCVLLGDGGSPERTIGVVLLFPGILFAINFIWHLLTFPRPISAAINACKSACEVIHWKVSVDKKTDSAGDQK